MTLKIANKYDYYRSLFEFFFEIRGGVDGPPNNQRMLPNFLSESGPPLLAPGGIICVSRRGKF